MSNGIEAPLLIFDSGTVDISADEALGGTATEEVGRRAIDVAQSFLIRELCNGPRPQKEMMEMAEAELINLKTLRKAKEKLCIKSVKTTGKNGIWLWQLPTAGLQSNMPQGAPS